MAFQFSLASVLRVRGVIEEREENVLQTIVAEIAQTSDSLEQIAAQLTQCYAARLSGIFKPSIALDLHATYGEVEQLKQRKKDLEAQMQKLEQARNAQLVVYAAARRNREMLTNMRDKERTAYDSAIVRREQKALDDNFIARRTRS
jgi:flagellar export protein FliJ